MWASGITAAVLWVMGGIKRGPVTGREEQPVTGPIAAAESWAALGASDPTAAARLGLAGVYERLGVALVPPNAVTPRQYAEGVHRTLEWLLNLSPAARPLPARRLAPPLPIPVRRADGSIPSGDELLERTVHADPYLASLPEVLQLSLRERVEAEAREYRRLAALIADVERRASRA